MTTNMLQPHILYEVTITYYSWSGITGKALYTTTRRGLGQAGVYKIMHRAESIAGLLKKVLPKNKLYRVSFSVRSLENLIVNRHLQPENTRN